MTAAAFVLPGAVRRAIIEHAERDRPRECCGLLIGAGNQVLQAIPMRNVADDPHVRFQLDAREHIAVQRNVRASASGRAVIGVYHSHPGGLPTPSARDVAEAHYPEWLYVIVGFSGSRARVRGFALRDFAMTPVRLVADGAVPPEG